MSLPEESVQQLNIKLQQQKEFTVQHLELRRSMTKNTRFQNLIFQASNAKLQLLFCSSAAN